MREDEGKAAGWEEESSRRPAAQRAGEEQVKAWPARGSSWLAQLCREQMGKNTKEQPGGMNVGSRCNWWGGRECMRVCICSIQRERRERESWIFICVPCVD